MPTVSTLKSIATLVFVTLVGMLSVLSVSSNERTTLPFFHWQSLLGTRLFPGSLPGRVVQLLLESNYVFRWIGFYLCVKLKCDVIWLQLSSDLKRKICLYFFCGVCTGLQSLRLWLFTLRLLKEQKHLSIWSWSLAKFNVASVPV